MTHDQIANLVNGNSQLAFQLEEVDIDKYAVVRNDDRVIGCIKVEKLSWYQADLSHLVVDKEFRRNGLATELIGTACEKAKKLGARIVQCTIRTDNVPSCCLFQKSGFSSGARFTGPSGKEVQVWQKSL